MTTKRLIGYTLLTVLLAGVLSGCGTHQGELGWLEESSEPNRNYRVVRSVTGKATSWSVLGIGTGSWNLYDRARRDLIQEANLEPGHRLINRTLDERTTGFPPKSSTPSLIDPILGLFQIYTRKEVYLSGEVVEITEPIE